eukprot:15060724-Alexandrium_andersonii.AAC.1
MPLLAAWQRARGRLAPPALGAAGAPLPPTTKLLDVNGQPIAGGESGAAVVEAQFRDGLPAQVGAGVMWEPLEFFGEAKK